MKGGCPVNVWNRPQSCLAARCTVLPCCPLGSSYFNSGTVRKEPEATWLKSSKCLGGFCVCALENRACYAKKIPLAAQKLCCFVCWFVSLKKLEVVWNEEAKSKGYRHSCEIVRHSFNIKWQFEYHRKCNIVFFKKCTQLSCSCMQVHSSKWSLSCLNVSLCIN